ncbi:MAG: flavin reductase family protein [Candidatus Woesearchaeota archaeon]
MEEVAVTEAFEKLKPEIYVFVISVDKEGKPNGTVTKCFMKCSNEPRMLAISLAKEGNTYNLIAQSKEFIVAVPNKELEPELDFFGTMKGAEIDKFKATKIKTEPARTIKSPLISDATINFECRLESQLDAGDHIILFGRVLASYINKDKKVLLCIRKDEGKRIFEEF